MNRCSKPRGAARAIALLGAICALALVAGGGVASAASLKWSAPRAIDKSMAQSLVQVSCPTASECAVLDLSGRALRYNPATAKASVPVQIAQGQPAIGVSCPSATQCTLVTPRDHAYTYNPQKARAPKPQTLEPATTPDGDDITVQGVACPTTSKCVATDTGGNVIAFGPGSSAAPVVTSLGTDGWNAISCPSATQCTVVGDNREATFNPASPAGTTPVKVAKNLHDMIDLACPTATQCTGLDVGGGEITFNPQVPPTTLPAEVLVADNTVSAITCPATTRCTTIAQNGTASTFNPTVSAPSVTKIRLEKAEIGGGPGQSDGIGSVACLSTSSCVAVDAIGRAINFAPTSHMSIKAVKIDRGTPLVGVSCPSTGQCTAIAPYDQVTFNPSHTRKAKHGTVVTDRFFDASGIACASVTDCLAVVTGHQATFNPRHFKIPKLRQLAAFTDAAILGLECPSISECVAADTDGYGITYNPRAGKFIKRRFKVEAGEALTGSACSSKTQCTAIDNDGGEVTFQPLTGKKIAAATVDASVGLDAPSGDSDNELDAISCPGKKLCVAVDSRGAAVAFNPRSKHQVKPTLIDPGNDLESISCPTTHRCVAVDDAGQVFAGGARPSTWKATSPKGAAALYGVDCPSSKECVAVDSTGDAFIGRS